MLGVDSYAREGSSLDYIRSFRVVSDDGAAQRARKMCPWHAGGFHNLPS